MTPAFPIRTAVAERFGVETPIFGFSHSVEVTVAVCLAGGIGVYGASRDRGDDIRRIAAEIRDRVGARPFGLDLLLPQGLPERNDRAAIEAEIPEGHRAFVRSIGDKYGVPPTTGPGRRTRFIRSREIEAEQLQAVVESDFDIFAAGIYTPADVVHRVKAQGRTVVSLTGSRRHALRAVDAGADIIVAQGYDAGGHTGQVGTFTLVPRVVDAVGNRAMVLAAGGVATGRHIAAALTLGAAGVWLGTAWLTTKEHNLSTLVLRKLLDAGEEDTVITRADSGKPMRQLRSAWSEEWARPDAPQPLTQPTFQDVLVGDFLGAVEAHGIEPLIKHAAGQAIGWFDRQVTVAQTMQRLVTETKQALADVFERSLTV